MKNLILVFFLLFAACVARADNFIASEMATLAMMQNLHLQPTSLPQTLSFKVTPEGTADFVEVTLTYPDLPDLQIFLRGPTNFWQDQLHTYHSLFVAAGFFTGADSAKLLSLVPGTVFVGFNYPYDSRDLTRDPGKVMQTFRVTPGLMALTLKWLSVQSWNNPHAMMAMGVSLGGLFLPAALHLAQKMDVTMARTVFAFTGSDLKSILINNLKTQAPAPAVDALGWLVPTVNTLNDPRLHLPYLKSSFLVISADADTIIPPAASQELFSLLKGPKQQVILHGGHIDVNQPQLIAETQKRVFAWLSRVN